MIEFVVRTYVLLHKVDRIPFDLSFRMNTLDLLHTHLLFGLLQLLVPVCTGQKMIRSIACY